MYKPYHAIGLELGISVASAGLRNEPTGAPIAWHGDVVATAKRALAAGETLDGEGGFTVYGKLLPAAHSLALGGLPLGLAHGVKLQRAVAAHAPVRWDDVESMPAPTRCGSGARWSRRSGADGPLPAGQAARRNVASTAPAAMNRLPKLRLTQRMWCGALSAASTRAASPVYPAMTTRSVKNSVPAQMAYWTNCGRAGR